MKSYDAICAWTGSVNFHGPETAGGRQTKVDKMPPSLLKDTNMNAKTV
jgi:hypothetical protein